MFKMAYFMKSQGRHPLSVTAT